MSGVLKAARAGARGFRPGVRSAQGDPGLFGGLVGGIKGGIGSFFGGGNPIAGAIAGARAGFGAGRPGRPAGPVPGTPHVPAIALPFAGLGGRPPPMMFPGANGGTVVGPPLSRSGTLTSTATVPAGHVHPSGHHLNKSAYFLRDGTFVPEGTRWVKNRHRNPLNPRALRRAISRIDAGKVWQGKLHEISTGKFTAAGNRKD